MRSRRLGLGGGEVWDYEEQDIRIRRSRSLGLVRVEVGERVEVGTFGGVEVYDQEGV